MNKVELAVCRIRQILPKNEGSLTRGSGCAVKCERLSSALGWKCSFLLVTSSSVVHCDELAAGKTFVADFLLKDKKGLESFELNLASDTCVDILGRNTAGITGSSADSSTKEQSMTIISVEKLDKRGFLKRMTKKSSLQTTRPLECFDTAKLSEELSDGLYCHITREGGQDFSTRTYKFLFETESHRFVLHDFGNAEITSVRGFPNDEMPLGAVIYTKRGEFAGLLEFSDEAIEPCFFPVEFRLSSTANGQPANEGLSNNNASTAPVSEEQADTQSKDDEGSAGLHDAKNDEEGKVMMHIEDEGQMSQGGVDSSASEHEAPVASSSPASVEVALDTSHQTEESAVEELQKGDAIPSCESAVVSDNQDEVLAEEQAVGEASLCQISEQESCNVDVDIATQEDAEVDNTGPEETAMPGDEGGENEHKTPADLLGTTSELLTSNSSVDDSTNAEGEILLNTMEKTEAGMVDPNKPVEPSDAAGEVVESAGVEEHSSFVVEMTVAGSVEPSQTSEDGSEESAQTSAVAEVFESAAQSGLGDEKLPDLGAEQDEGLPEPVDATEESQPNNEAESSTQTEEKASAVVVCSPEAQTDQDPVTDITPTASTDANLNDEKEDSRDKEPRESFELVEQQINVVEMAEDGEDITEDARLERDQGEPGHLENETDENKQEGPGEGMEDEERLKLSEVGVSEIGERSEQEVGGSLNREEDREVGEDKETEKTAMTDRKGEDEEEVKTGDQEDEDAEKSGDEPQAVEVNGEPDKDEEGETEKLLTPDEETKDGEGEDDAKVSIEGKENEEVEEADGSENREPGQRVEEVPLTKEEERNEGQEEREGDDLNDIVPQKFDGDSLLSETITNNSRLLDELAKCLDTDYQYSLLPNWRDMADLLAIPPEAYEHYDVYSVSSPTEDLFVFLSSTRPDLSMKEIREALAEIGRQDVVKIIDKFRTRQLISDESVVGSLVEREDRDLLGKLALALDRGSAVTWRHLAEQLAIPRRVYRNFGSGQGSNSALLLLKYLPIFDPDLTIGDLKELLEKIFRHEAAAVLSSAGIPDDEHVRYILDDTELMEQISDLLNEDPPSPNWRQLAKELRVPQEKCRLFENTDEKRSCTKLLLRSLEKSEPDLTVEELILALVAMKRQDVLDVLAKYLNGDDIDSILEENNLLLDESLDSLSGGDTAN